MPKSRQKKIKAVDPFCTGTRKALLRAKDKELNRAPKNINDQEVPRSLKNMLEASKMAKQRQGQKQSVQKLGSVERIPGESHNRFMKRVGLKAKKKLHKVRSMLESDEMGSDGRITSDMALKKNKERIAVLQQRIKGKKFERNIDNQEKDFFKDRVEFGEVVSAPPVLTAKPRKSSDKTDKPGNRQLLLTSMFDKRQAPQDDQHDVKKSHRTEKTSQDHGAKTKKRKHMTNAEKRRFDRSRDAAILAYRKAKGHTDRTVKS